ncbi:MAG: hypothetical protein IJ736_10550, partial [Firmicutes bacterium]|nr:hypothetical protein [Bacillota bacterium]
SRTHKAVTPYFRLKQVLCQYFQMQKQACLHIPKPSLYRQSPKTENRDILYLLIFCLQADIEAKTYCGKHAGLKGE